MRRNRRTSSTRLLPSSNEHLELGPDLKGSARPPRGSLLPVNDNGVGIEGETPRSWRVTGLEPSA